MRTWMITLAGGLTLSGAALAVTDDWTQWRGPDLDGISKETDWNPTAGEVLWEKNVGLGYSSVIVFEDVIYTMGWTLEDGTTGGTRPGGDEGPMGEDTVWCLDRETGDELWSYSFPAKKWSKYHGGGTNCTPTLAGDSLYVLNREGKLFSLDAGDGTEQWKVDLKAKYGVELPVWGLAASPLAVGDQIIVNVGRVVAFSDTGKELWKSEDFGHAYSTPTPANIDGKACLVTFNGNGLAVLDRKNGKTLQTFEWKTKYDVNAATPIMVDEKRCFISSGYDHGCAMLELGTSGDPKVLWENKRMRNKMAGCVLFDDHLYGFDEAIFKCIDLDGNEKWRQRGLGDGAHTLAGGKLIVISSDGELVTANASTEGFEELKRWDCVDGGPCWTPPTLSSGLIYLRNNAGQLVCRDHSAQ